MPTATYDIKIEGLDKLMAAMRASPQIMEPILQQAVVQSTVILASHTDRDTVPWITGTLARSFNPARIERLLGRWFPRVNYAASVQFGMPASPGRYVPAIGKRLVNSSRPGFGTWPGFKGRFFMEKIRNASIEEINGEFKTALNNFTKTLASQ